MTARASAASSASRWTRVRRCRGRLRRRFEALTGEATKVDGAGRTDSGVHATGQGRLCERGATSRRRRGSGRSTRCCRQDVAVRVVARSADDFPCAAERLIAPLSLPMSCAIRYGLRSVERYAWRVAGPLDVAAMQSAAECCSASTTSARSARVLAIAAPRGFVGIRCARCLRRSATSGREAISGRATARGRVLLHRQRLPHRNGAAVGRDAGAGRRGAALGWKRSRRFWRHARRRIQAWRPRQGAVPDGVEYPARIVSWRGHEDRAGALGVSGESTPGEASGGSES